MMSREEIMLRADERCALAKAEDGLRGLILCSFDAIHHGHGEVENHQVRLYLLSFLQSVQSVFCLATFEFQFLEVPTQGFADVWLVIDD
jgi:hypothetical protein